MKEESVIVLESCSSARHGDVLPDHRRLVQLSRLPDFLMWPASIFQQRPGLEASADIKNVWSYSSILILLYPVVFN
jgi:hypothetical protein